MGVFSTVKKAFHFYAGLRNADHIEVRPWDEYSLPPFNPSLIVS